MGRPMILVAEDEEAVRELLCELLRGAGFEVLCACDGREATDTARAATPPVDLVVTDVVMPAMSGPELVRTLRAERPSLPALFVSGFAERLQELQRELASARTAFLPKPFAGEQLVAAVRRLLDDAA